jgi:hypothetical protein
LGTGFDDKEDKNVLDTMVKSRLTRSRSNTSCYLVKKKDVLLTSCSTYVYAMNVWSICIRPFPWLVAQPDAVAVIRHSSSQDQGYIVEVNARTAAKSIT